MSKANDASLSELLDRWQSLHERGHSVSLEELCNGNPERVEELRRHIHGIESMLAFLQISQEQTVSSPEKRRFTAGETGEMVPDARIQPIPGYEVLEELGRGGMGVVYRARQVKASRLVALKTIQHASHADSHDLTRFRIEAEAVARMQHPNIVQIFEVGEHDGLPFFSMELCLGGNLASRMAASTLVPADAARLVERLARAMHEAHRQNVIHRDLKPANILLTGDGPEASLAALTPKVADFGLARMLDHAGQTQSGAVVGTASYMAPEQARGHTREHGPAVDVYALGAILYECLTARPPFKAATAMETLLQVMRNEPVAPSRLAPGLPRDLETICLKCLDKEPARRYATAEALADDLRCFLGGEPITARPVGWVERAAKWARRRWVVASLLGLSVGLILSLLVASLVLWQNAEQRAGLVRDLGSANQHLEEAGGRLEETNRQIAQRQQQLEKVRLDAQESLTQLHRTRREVYASDMLLAERAWKEGEITSLDQILTRYVSPSGQEDLRGWEWRYLNRVRYNNQRVLRGHSRTVFSVAFSPDGRYLATSSSDQTVLIWDVATGQQIKTLRGPQAALQAVAFSADGKRVVAGANHDARGRNATEWDLASGKVLRRSLPSTGMHNAMMDVAFSPDGARVVWGYADWALHHLPVPGAARGPLVH